MAPRALLTGGSGFVGRWLASALVRDGWEVFSTTTAIPYEGERVAWTRRPEWHEMSAVSWIAGDVRDATHLADALDRARPDAIIPLAAISSVPVASKDPALAWEVNALSTVRLLAEIETRRDRGELDPTVIAVGSSEQYGRYESATSPLRETDPMRPRTVYGASKLGQEIAAMQAHEARGMRIMAVRPFVHTGPGQETRFLLPALVARAVALRTAPPGTPLTMGNSSPVRDFLHVRDAVSAYISLLRLGVPGTVYNVAGGEGMSVRQVAERVLAAVGVDAPAVEDPALVRAVDVPYLVGDTTRLRVATGWAPQYTFDDLLHDLLDDHLRHAATH